MERAVSKRILLSISLAGIVVLAGCDRFYGPSVTNAYGEDVQMIAYYSDGTHWEHDWRPCGSFFLGGVNDESIKPIKLRIEKDGKLLREFSAEELAAMDAEDRATSDNDGTGWNVSAAGARLVKNSEPNPCRRR